MQPLQKGAFLEPQSGVALQEITDHFGRDFGDFLETNAWLRESMRASADRPTYTVSRDMPWAERFLLVRAIDKISIPTLREGGRVAYLLLFGGRSWEAEKRKFADRRKVAENSARQIFGVDSGRGSLHTG